MPKIATDPIGPAISEAAQKARDSKLQAAKDNLAGDPKLAKAAAEHVGRFVASVEGSRLQLDDKLNVFYALWNGKSISRFVSSARSIHVPEPFKAVEAFVARIVSVLIGPANWFRVVGIDDKGKKNAALIRDLMMTQLRLDDFPTKFTTFMRSCGIYGFAPGKVRWRLKKRTIKYNKVTETEKLEDGTPVGVTVKSTPAEETIILDGPTLEYTDVFDFYTDLRFPDTNESPGQAWRQERSEEYVLQCGERDLWKNVDALTNPESTRAPDARVPSPVAYQSSPTTFRRIRDMHDGLHTVPGQDKPISRMYEVFEYWGVFDPKSGDPAGKQGREEEYVITVARRLRGKDAPMGWTTVRVAKHPYWHGRRPGVVAHHTRRAHCFQSVGLIEPIAKLSMELDDRRNMGLAAAALAVKPITVVDPSFPLYSNDTVLEPGTILRGPVDGIKPFFIPDRSSAAMTWENAIKQDIREATGMISQMQGGPTERAETATAFVGYIREANKRLQEVARNVAEHFLIPMLEMWHSMNQQMITTERQIEILGEDGLAAEIKKVTPAEVTGRVHFEIEAAPQVAMAGIEAQMMTNFLNTAAPLLERDPGMIDVEALLRHIWTKNHGSGDIDDIFPRAKTPRQPRSTEDEHHLIAAGHSPMPQPGENLNAHINGHLEFTKTSAFEKWGDDAQRRLLAHIENTKLELQRFMEKMAIPQMPEGVGPQPEGTQQGQQAPAPQRRGPTTPQGAVRSNVASMEPRTSGMPR